MSHDYVFQGKIQQENKLREERGDKIQQENKLERRPFATTA